MKPMRTTPLLAGILSTGLFAIATGMPATASAKPWPPLHSKPEKAISLEKIGSYSGSGAEISAYDVRSDRLFVISGGTRLEILDLSDPSTPALIATIDVTDDLAAAGGANSVAVKRGVVAVAVENTDKQAAGFVAFYDQSGRFINAVSSGALPDMLTFTHNGKQLLVANEGEPDDSYSNDPEGTVSIIDMRGGAASLTDADVTTLDFNAFNVGAPRHDELADTVRIFGPGATVAQDLEPEYITVSRNNHTAWVSLQENNALAIINLKKPAVEAIVPLGFKDHSDPANPLDASNKDDAINIRNWPVLGMYQPDGIASYRFRGREFIVTANEGDARDYDGYSEEVRVHDLTLDPAAFPTASDLQLDENLGRLKTTTATGDADGDGVHEQIYAYGARSFSIWSGEGEQVYDSADDFEQITAAATPGLFNSQGNDPAEFDDRSDDKGPEPEGVVVAKLEGRNYAFIGLERIGGIMVYDVSNPYSPRFQQYLPAAEGDVSPEGMLVLSEWQSPDDKPLLIVSYEVSGTIGVFRINIED